MALITTLPFATECTDTVVYGCKDLCLSPWVYEAICSAVKLSTVVSPRDKTHTNIETSRGVWLSFLFPIGHFGHMKTIHQFTKNRQFFKTTLEKVSSGPQEISDNHPC